MIKIHVGNNANTKPLILDEKTTPTEAMRQAGVNTNATTLSLDGEVLSPREMSKTLKELGASEGSFLVAVTKTTDN